MGGPESLNNPLLMIGAPPDAVAWVAFAGAVISALASPFARRWLEGKRQRPLQVLAGLALGAAVLSAGYVAVYLRGGPRIVDATSYWLEARALSEGHLAFGVPDPSAAFRGRFLVSPTDSERLAVIFPPGYPALLAGGFLIGAPLAVGPLIAAALVVATFALCRELFGRDDIALVAALFSAISATLRYHTADTMSHGWSALLMTLALLACFRARRSPRSKVAPVLGGLAAGWLFATRPITGIVALALGTVLLLRSPTVASSDRARLARSAAAAAFLGGAIPGVALLLLHQKAATGSWLGSSQLRYYELADGPPGCFRYGFGTGIGCLYEHGDFVRARLSGGFGFVEALSTTLRRLQHHALDVANFEPLILMVLAALVAGARVPAVRWLGVGVASVVLAYVPFYFDGTYPGGGARFYADVLPLEHALLSWGLVRLRAVFVAVPLALLGFSVHGVFSHRALAQREGGRPMFEPELLERAGISRGLVFVDTDHGFNLGHVPEHHDATRGLVVARGRGDGHDRAVWEVLGRPSAYRYRFDPFARDVAPRVEVERFETTSFRFESEAEWPVLAISGGWARPEHTPAACASGGRGLYLLPTTDRPVQVSLEAWSPRAAAYNVRMQVVSSASGAAEVALLLAGSRWAGRRPPGGEPCWGLSAGPVRLERGSHRLMVESAGGEVMVDYVELGDAVASPHPAAKGPGR